MHVNPPQLFAKWELLVTTAQACPRQGLSCVPVWAPGALCWVPVLPSSLSPS